MTTLDSIPGIGKSSLELLEAAGFSSAETLARAGVDELAKELERANRILQISSKTPEWSEVEEWIGTARSITGIADEKKSDSVSMPINYEKDSKVAAQLASAPFAIPLPGKYLMEHKIPVGDIPPAMLLNRYSGELDVKKTEERAPAPRVNTSSVQSVSIRGSEALTPSRLDIDVDRVKPLESMAGSSKRMRKSGSPKTAQDERVALIRSPKEETNKGKDPNSRRYIRGVLHSHPMSMIFGAIVTLLVTVMLPIAIASGLLLLLSRQMPGNFSWVPPWVLAFPAALPVFGIMYLIWGRGSCRICGQRQFVPRMTLKNAKAHYVPGLGYIIPVCFHILLFRWFRCTYCGTPVRLKK